MRRFAVMLVPLLLLAACSAPPQKELDLAQGAIDAARAAGAEQYATPEFTGATAALQQANDAVAQRDYRLALTRALDAHDRAQTAAKAAADGKARARSEAAVALLAATGAIDQLRARVEAAKQAKLPDRELRTPAGALATAEESVQKARSASSGGDYLAATGLVKGLPEEMKRQITALEAAAAKKPARPARRGRR